MLGSCEVPTLDDKMIWEYYFRF